MSRDGSGEVYVIGKGYKGISTILLTALQYCRLSIYLLLFIFIPIPGVQSGVCDKPDRAVFPKDWIPDDFMEEFIKCGTKFAELQDDAIQLNLR